MGLKEFLDMYDFSELFNQKPKNLIESKMNKAYKKTYYFLQYLRETLMIIGTLLLIIWLFNKDTIFLYYGVYLWIGAACLAVITQQMRQYIVRTYNL